MGLAVVCGLILAIVGGLAAIGTAIYVSKSAVALWALILLGWGVAELKRYNRTSGWEPFAVGFLMCVMYLVIAGAAYYLKSPVVLWAMIPVGWIAEAIVD